MINLIFDLFLSTRISMVPLKFIFLSTLDLILITSLICRKLASCFSKWTSKWHRLLSTNGGKGPRIFVPRWDPRINSGEPKFPSLPHSNRGLQSQACQAGLLHFKPGPGIVCLVDHPNSGSVQVIYLFGFMCLVVIWIPCIHGIVCNP